MNHNRKHVIKVKESKLHKHKTHVNVIDDNTREKY